MSSSPSLLSRRRATPELELPVPPEFRCPISLDLMRDPVVGPTGITYDRAGIEAWLLAAARCPVTKGDLRADDLVPNHALRRVIQAWCVANRCRGVERIPTPRVPLTPAQAAEALAARRLQAVVIKEILASGAAIDVVTENLDAIIEVLVETIKDRISPQATKASLIAAYHLALAAADDHAAATRLAEAGIVAALVELLIDSGDRNTAEKALAALDATLVSDAGKARARADALAVPVLVKKMFRVSDTVTELVVSALHRICKKCGGDDEATAAARRSAVVDAVQVGAFQKLMMLLQVGCKEEATKEKATELLKLMIKYEAAGGGGCIDAMDFRGLKRL
uniref:U-box domain-containing protein n=1 Tax=Leersia perrieri TaxID=77586 RepID=A0A0D9XHF5_9ORYZ